MERLSSGPTVNLRSSGARRGRRRKKEITEEEHLIEVRVPNEESPLIYRPSSSLLPARPLGAPLELSHKPIIKKEKEDTESNIIPSKAAKVDCSNREILTEINKLLENCRSLNGFQNHESPSKETQQSNNTNQNITEELIDRSEVSSSTYGSYNPQSSEVVPGSSVGCAVTFSGISPTADSSNCYEQTLPIKCEPRSRSSSTETVLAVESEQTPLAENQFVASAQSFTPEVQVKIEPLDDCETLSPVTGNKRSGTEITATAKKLKIGLLPLISAEDGADREIVIRPQSHEHDLMNYSLPKSTVSLNTDCHMDHKTASIVKEANIHILEKTGDSRSDPQPSSYNKSTATSVAQNVLNSSEECNHSNLPFNTQVVNPQFISSKCSENLSNVSVSKHDAPTTQRFVNKSFKTILVKFIQMNTDRGDVGECLNYLNHKYSQKKDFSLFFDDIPLQTQRDDSVVKPVESSPVTSNASPKDLISTNELMKIIEFSTQFQNHNASSQSSSGGNAASRTESISLPSATILSNLNLPSQASATKSQSSTSDQTFNPQIQVKTEPVDESDVSISPSRLSNMHCVPASNKRSWDSTREVLTTGTDPAICSNSNERSPVETPTEILTIGKKIKTEPVSPDRSTSSIRCLSNTVENDVSNKSKKVSCNKNTVPFTENIPTSSVNSHFNTSQPYEAENRSVSTHQSFIPEIHIKTEPLDDYETSASDTSSMSSKRNTGEIGNDIHQMAKNRKTAAEHVDHSVSSVRGSEVKTSKISTVYSLNTEKDTSAGNVVSVTESTVKNSSSMSNFSLVSISSIKPTPTIQTDSITSKMSSYSHLLPDEITAETVTGTDNVLRNSCRISNLYAVPSNVNSENMPTVLKSDRLIPTNSNDPRTRIPVVNRFLHTYDTQLGERINESNNFGVERNSGDISNSSLCGKIKKKKLTPEEYLQRKASLSARDPRLSKRSQVFLPQTSLADSASRSVQPCMSLVNQQNVGSVLHDQNVHLTSVIAGQPSQRSLSLERVSRLSAQSDTLGTRQLHSVSSTGNRCEEPAQNVKDLQCATQADAKLLINTPPDRQISGSKSYFKKSVGSRRGSQTSSRTLLRRNVGKKFIETDDLPFLILEWEVDWLPNQLKTHVCPPICDSYPRVKHTYQSIQEYYNTYLPLHLLNVWLRLLDSWKSSPKIPGVFEEQQEIQNFVRATCSVIVKASDESDWPKREDILICSSKKPNGPIKKLFGRVLGIIESNYVPVQGCPYYGETGPWKKLYLDILCSESFGVQLLASIRLQILINIRIVLKENDALKYMNPSMRGVILNPKEHRSVIQTLSVQPFQGHSNIQGNVSRIVNCVQSPLHLVTLVNTPSSVDNTLAVLHVFPHLLRTDTMLIVCLKDENAFLDLAKRMVSHNAILAIKDDELPHLPADLRNFTVSNCDSQILQSSLAALTLTKAMFFGNLEGRLTKETVICMVHDAQYFSEPETALLLRFKVERLILIGRSDSKAEVHPILTRYGYDTSLFHRFSR